MPGAEVELRELCRDPRRRKREAELVEDRERQLEEPPRLFVSAAPRGHAAGVGVKLRAPDGLVRELGGLLEISLRFASRAEGICSAAGSEEHLPRLHLDLAGVLGVRERTVRIEVVRRQ